MKRAGSEQANWILARMLPWPESPDAWPLRVGTVIPTGFESYVRIMHPASRESGPTLELLDWQSITGARGVMVDALTCWEEIDPADSTLQEPSEGCLPLETMRALVAVLHSHTPEKMPCWFGVWDGWGTLDADRRWPGAGKLALPNRDYVLLKGSLDTASESLVSSPCYQTANLWWPEDRSWMVSTEIDYRWTFIGGNAACIADIVSDHRLETFEVRAEDRVSRRR